VDLAGGGLHLKSAQAVLQYRKYGRQQIMQAQLLYCIALCIVNKVSVVACLPTVCICSRRPLAPPVQLQHATASCLRRTTPSTACIEVHADAIKIRFVYSCLFAMSSATPYRSGGGGEYSRKRRSHSTPSRHAMQVSPQLPLTACIFAAISSNVGVVQTPGSSAMQSAGVSQGMSPSYMHRHMHQHQHYVDSAAGQQSVSAASQDTHVFMKSVFFCPMFVPARPITPPVSPGPSPRARHPRRRSPWRPQLRCVH